MLNHIGVSCELLIIWSILFVIFKRKLINSKIYFFLLFIMASAGLVLPIDILLDTGSDSLYHYHSFINIAVFALLLVSGLIPWMYFDKWFKRIDKIAIRPQYINYFKVIMTIMIFLSIYAIIYALPYAILAYQMGGQEVRHTISESSLLPNNIFTTISVGIGYLAPFYIVCCFLALMTPSLKRYAIYMFIFSLTYIVTSAPFLARDGFFIIPLTYACLYLQYRRLINLKNLAKLKRYFFYFFPVLVSLVAIISIDRFYYRNDSINSFISGTWGYLYQQPYVFSQMIEDTNIFEGTKRILPLLALLIGDNKYQTGEYNYKFESMFGTQYGSFYLVSGWVSLILCSIFFVASWRWLFGRFKSQNNILGASFAFALYLYYILVGIFYFRFSAISVTLTYAILIFACFNFKNVIKITYKKH